MMSIPDFKPEAAAEADEAFLWYEGQSAGLGLEFMRALDACMSQILRFPDGCPISHDGLRRAMLRRFPYGIFYIASEGSSTIYAVFHSKRDPLQLVERI